MGSEWREYRLADLGSIVTGRTPPASRPGDFGDSVPFLTPTDMDGRRTMGSTARSLSREGARAMQRAVVPGGVAVSCIGWQMGKTVLVDRPALTNQQINTIVPDETWVDPLFLYYTLSAKRSQIFALGAGGSRTPILNKSDFGKIPLVMPPLIEQRRIAGILGALDDKIELNRRMSQTLESMARALFKSWFVDFDPVRAKSEGRDPGLPPNVAELFPDSFDDSEIGEIPRGWRTCGLDEIADFLNGLALQRFPANDGRALPVIKIAQLHAGNTDGADEASADIPSDYVVKDGDVLFSWSGSLSVELWCGGPGALNQHLFKVTSKRYPKWFYYLWTREHLADFREIAAGKATTMGHIQRGHLTSARALVPPDPLVDLLGSHLDALLSAQVECRVQSRTLSDVRQSLLPNLLSGELASRVWEVAQ